jgi:hypothetical protein
MGLKSIGWQCHAQQNRFGKETTMESDKRGVFMNWQKFTTLLLFSIIATFLWGTDQGWGQPQSGKAVQNQLNDAQNAAAEARKAKGLRRSTTNDGRKAATKRTAERKAQYKKNLKAKGGATQ